MLIRETKIFLVSLNKKISKILSLIIINFIWNLNFNISKIHYLKIHFFQICRHWSFCFDFTLILIVILIFLLWILVTRLWSNIFNVIAFQLIFLNIFIHFNRSYSTESISTSNSFKIWFCFYTIIVLNINFF